MPEVSPSADPSSCDREPVHIPGAIQPFGCLVAFSLPTWSIAHVSANAAGLFGAASPEAMIGAQMETVLTPKAIHDLRNTFQAAMISNFAERMQPIPVGVDGELHDILVHASGSLAIAEFLPCGGAESVRVDPTTLVKTIIDRLRRTTTFQSFLTSAARQIRAVTGFRSRDDLPLPRGRKRPGRRRRRSRRSAAAARPALSGERYPAPGAGFYLSASGCG